jgi:hypothetical protein
MCPALSWHIAGQLTREKTQMFDRFDVCMAYYLFACEWHSGQNSPEYRIFGRLHNLGFRPSPMLSRRSLSDNGRCILAGLIRKARRGESVGR